jgi:NAD(P)H-dependent FMN reductase
MMTSIRILAISGSVRRASLDTRLLGQTEEIAPPGTRFDHFERLGEILRPDSEMVAL